MTERPEDDAVPVSVRLGEVVPPEDPEDWTRPLTWVAALGMLAAPVLAAAWFLLGPPGEAERAGALTFLLAALLAGGAAATGATQRGVARPWTATLAAGLFAALAVIILGVVLAGERQVAVASPTLAHAFAASVGGLAGAITASGALAVGAIRLGRPARAATAVPLGVATAVATVAWLMP